MMSRAAASAFISCPPPDQLVAFIGGELPEQRAIDIEAHMDECGECRAVLSNMARGGPPPALGRYRIDTVLGSGGMGIVYRGFDPQLARPVAIKVVRRAGDDTQGRARLVREAQALARLSHPNVCHVYDVGTEDDEVWVAMELIDGVHLRQWAAEGPSSAELMACLLGAAEGIAAAHAAGLVHRDIKPENVLVTRDQRPIVTDFGLARHEDAVDPNAQTVSTDPNLTATGAIAGTPAYLAPEQLLGDPIDARVDQFAWAVMAWELITNSRPFPVVFAVRVEAVRAGLAQPANMPKHVFEALSRAMAASPSDRYPSMRELITALKTGPAEKAAGPIVPTKGRAAALAGLAVLGASAIAVVAWPKKSSSPTVAESSAPAPAPPVTDVTPPLATQPPAPQPQPSPQQPAPQPQPQPQLATQPPRPAPQPLQPKTAPRDTKKDVTKEVPAPTPAPAQPAPPPSEPQMTQSEPQPPVIVSAPASPPRGRYCRSCQIASADAFCRIPADFTNTGYAKNYGVVDWGIVTKVETETGSFRDETIKETVITLRGQRKTYRFTADFLDSVVTTNVGAHLAICPEDQNDLYQLSGGPTDLTRAVITMSGPPNTKIAAKLGAKHVSDLALAATSLRKRFDDRITEDGRYLIHAKVHGIDGARYKMDRYWMSVPKGMKNEDKLDTNKMFWFVVENPEFVEIDGEERLLVKAAAILDDIFPQ